MQEQPLKGTITLAMLWSLPGVNKEESLFVKVNKNCSHLPKLIVVRITICRKSTVVSKMKEVINVKEVLPRYCTGIWLIMKNMILLPVITD